MLFKLEYERTLCKQIPFVFNYSHISTSFIKQKCNLYSWAVLFNINLYISVLPTAELINMDLHPKLLFISVYEISYGK